MSSQSVTRAAAASHPAAVSKLAAKRPVSDIQRLWIEMGGAGSSSQAKTALPTVAATKWTWSVAAKCPLHDDDLHVMVRYVGQLANYLFTGGKDGAVVATTFEEADQGRPGCEVVPARWMMNQHNQVVAAWVTAMAVHPHEAIVVVGYRDGLIQCYDVTDPVQWVPKQSIEVVARRNDKQKGNNEGRIHHLSYVSAVESEGNKPVLAVGVSGALVRVTSKGKQTQIRLQEGVWLNDLVELSPKDICLLEGEIVSQYRWSGKRDGWKKLVGVRLGNPAENASAGFKGDWRKEPFWEAVEKAQPYGVSMLHLKGRKQLAVSLNSGAIRLLNLVSDGAQALKINCLDNEQDSLITGLCPWIWNDYSFAGHAEQGRPSRRCWKIVDLGDETLAVGTDSGELPVVDLRTKKVVSSILVRKLERAAVLVWDQQTQHLYTHSSPSDLSKGTGATLFAFQLRQETPVDSSQSR
jgi:WD40 repeat protein